MEIGAILLGSAVFISTIPYVFGPFRRSRGSALQKLGVASPKTLKGEREAERRAALQTLRDLDFDFQTGKITAGDHEALRASLLAKAASLIDQQEEEDNQVEALIQARRAQIAPGIIGPAGSTCSSCHTRLLSEDRFCPKCGTPRARSSCSACGTKLAEEALFCSHCGEAVKKPQRNQ